jgi:hypothetical protein
MGGEPAVVVDGAPGDDETHGGGTYRPREGAERAERACGTGRATLDASIPIRESL